MKLQTLQVIQIFYRKQDHGRLSIVRISKHSCVSRDMCGVRVVFVVCVWCVCGVCAVCVRCVCGVLCVWCVWCGVW